MSLNDLYDTNDLNVNLTALSNSQLKIHNMYPIGIDISFDRLSITGNVIEKRIEELARFISNEPFVNVFEHTQTHFRLRALDDKIYMEYDKIKAKSRNRRNTKIEFNPNKLNQTEKTWIKNNLLCYIEDMSFTRLDLAFDFTEDLSDYYIMTDIALTSAYRYGRNSNLETIYLGSKKSNRYIRIYNKKKEIKDTKGLDLDVSNLWRIEFELKGDFISKWMHCLDDLHVLKPEWKDADKIQDRAMLSLLLTHNEEWKNLEKRSKRKYKHMIKELSSLDLVAYMYKELEIKLDSLSAELIFWIKDYVYIN